MDEMEGFGKRLRNLRQDRGLTQVELGNRSGISQKDISKYERGTTANLLATNLIRLADALGVSVDYLLGRVDHE